MRKVSSKEEFLSRLNQAKHSYERRNQLVMLCNEMYEMKQEYSSTYLSTKATAWRAKVSPEYWESDSRPQNVIDVITAVLAGNAPQWKAYVPGNEMTTLPTRAETFLAGVLRLNSRRQQMDIMSYLTFRTALDGGAGLRIYWDTEAPGPGKVKPVQLPESDLALPLGLYSYTDFPVVLDVIPITKLYPVGRGRQGRPFDELYHVDMRTPSAVAADWENEDGSDTSWLSTYKTDDRDFKEFEYIEWWGEDAKGQVHYACMFDKQFVIKPKPVDYPTIPYVITTFKIGDKDRPEMERIPFLFPILWSTQKKEYLKSRNFRLADIYGNMPPITRGHTPLDVSGNWGDSMHLQPEESIEFPKWQGNPPDIYKMIEDAETDQAEGTFSPAMFGQVSSRMSGYALSQLVGSDTLRVDTPKRNLELALGLMADIIFGLLQKFSPDAYRGINMQVTDGNGKDLTPMLCGKETELLTVEAFIKPRHIADEIRLATLGAQLAALPKPPVSESYILSKYFGVEQPEAEIRRRLGEEVIQDPLVRLISMLEVLQESNHFAAPIIQQKVSELTQQQLTGGQQPPQQQPGPAQLGGGLPQAVGGNPPQPGPMGNPVEEIGQTQEAALYGGPRGV